MSTPRTAVADGPAPRPLPWEGLDRALDALSDAVAVFGAGGTLLSANRAMREALEDPADPTLRDEVARTVAAARAAFRRGPSSDGEEPVSREVRVRGGIVALRASRLPALGHGLEGGLLVALRPGPGTALSGAALRARFGLSPQEGRVATLLAEGATNEEVACRLNISPHTARHHVGRVLAKLRVRSRSAVAAALLRGEGARP